MSRQLKIWNGRGYCCVKRDDPRWHALKFNDCPHAYVAAYSRADARKVIEEYCGRLPPDSELRDYWSAGCWGTAMASITPERGLWIQFDSREKPVRV